MYSPRMFSCQFKMMLYDFLAISIWNVFVECIIISVVKSISFGSKIHRILYLNVLLITSCGVQTPHKENFGSLTLFRSHFFQVFVHFSFKCFVLLSFVKFTSVLSQVRFICLL